MSKILCLDFDGVLHSYSSGWKGARNIPDPPVAGAMEFLCEALSHFEVAIHSSRSRYFGGRRAMKAWLRRQMLEYFWKRYGANETLPVPDERLMGLGLGLTATDVEDHLRPEAESLIDRIAFPLWKPAAFVTLDDRAITFQGWWPAIAELKAFKPWNKS
jgi:hypothetical protein